MESNNKKLYAVYLRGKADRCNIELHDVVFVVGSSIEETYHLLKKKWFGNPDKVHIDSYICLEFADKHSIRLSQSKQKTALKLFFVNFGGYKSGIFAEFHDTGFFVATSSAEAIRKAKKKLGDGLTAIHKDDVLDLDVDDVLEISEVDRYYINLEPSNEKDSYPISAYKLMK